MEIQSTKSEAKTLENSVKKPVLAWDPDYTKATPAEHAAMERAARELEAVEYVAESAINWD